MAPAEALAAAGAVLEEATAAQRHGLIVGARMRLCQAAMALGHHSEAARHARQIATLDADTGSDDLYRGEVWLTAIQALTYVDPPKAIELTHNAAQWLREIAAKHVEPSFRESFLSRNPVNRDLLALRSRLNG